MRGGVFWAGWGQKERAVEKLDASQPWAAGQLGPWHPPVQPACNHQVQHQPKIAFYSNRDTLADSPQLANDATLHTCNRWLCGSKQKRASKPYSNERPPDDAWFERSNVRGDIRQFRHAYQLAGCACAFATSPLLRINAASSACSQSDAVWG